MTETIHIIDDDKDMRESLKWLLSARLSVPVALWASAEAFLGGRPEELDGCVVLDIAMPGMSGLELLESQPIPVPVIMLTAHADVPSAVRAIRAGARTMLEKPVAPELLVEHVRSALRSNADDAPRRRRRVELQRAVAAITPRERVVVACYLRGLVTKDIAAELEISIRTVEVHKANILEKIGINSMAEAVRQMAIHGIEVDA